MLLPSRPRPDAYDRAALWVLLGILAVYVVAVYSRV